MSLCPRGHVVDSAGTCDVCEHVDARPSVAGVATPADKHGEGRPFPRTDAGNAELLTRLYGDRLRYDHRRRRWLSWQGDWWAPDVDAEVVRLAKETARRRYLEAACIDDLRQREAEANWAISSENRFRLEAALNLAKAELPIADAGDRWDANGWLLGVANGQP